MTDVFPNPVSSHDRVRRIVRRRRALRRARLGALALVGLVVAGAAGYGVVEGIAYGRHLWSAINPKVTTPSVTTAPGSTTTSSAGPPACQSAQVDAYLSHWLITGGTLYEIVGLDDTSANPCTLAGYASLAVTSPDGGIVPALLHDDATLGSSGGAATTPLAMVAGQRAWFEISYPVSCTQILAPGATSSGAAGDCYQGTTLLVLSSSPGTGASVPQPLHFTYGASGITVGPFGAGTPPPSPPVT